MDQPPPKVLTDADVERVLDPASTLGALGRFLRLLSDEPGSASVRISAGDADPFVISAGSTRSATGLRAYSAARRDEAVTVLWDRATRRARAVHIGNRLGELRTAGCNAIAAKEIMMQMSVAKVGILGAGAQAQSHALMFRHVWPRADVQMWSRSRSRAQAADRSLKSKGASVMMVDSAAAAAESAQIVVAATSADRPVIELTSLFAARLLVAVGPKGTTRHELPSEVGDRAERWTTDSAQQLRAYPARTIFDRARDVADTLPDLKPSRVGSFTIHVSVGVPGSEVALLEHLCRHGTA